MRWVFTLLVFIFVEFLFGQDYYSIDAKTFFDKGYANDTAELENLNKKLLQATVFHQTNLQRVKKHQFRFDSNLEKAAMFHSLEMQNQGFFSHANRKNKKYRTPSLRAKKFNADFVSVGENILEEIAFDYKNNSIYDSKLIDNRYVFYHNSSGERIRELTYKELAEKVVKSWMNSAGHKANILDKGYSHLGVGVVINPYGEDKLPFILVTQLFGGNV